MVKNKVWINNTQSYSLKVGWGNVVSKKTTFEKKDSYDIFDYFWSKGFYITSGIKFGGNYLLYENDPMCTHSDYIVGIYTKDQAILPLDIISMGRVGTNVKKTFVLTAKEEKEVTTFSVEWAGF